MIKKKPPVRRNVKSLKLDKQEGIVFDVDAVVLLGAITYNIRHAIRDLAIEKANGKNPVPLSSVEDAIKTLRLSKYQ